MERIEKPAEISLREITSESLVAVLRLAVHETQKRLVASNAVSIAQAHFSQHAWFRAIYAGEAPVGFVMLEEKPEEPEYWLWRFMIDARHQRRGYGERALALVIEHVREQPGAKELLLGVVPSEGNAQAFYEKSGFTLTGEVEEGESIMRFDLAKP